MKSPLIDDIMSRIVLLTKTKLHAIQLMHAFRKLLRFQHCGTLQYVKLSRSVRLEFNRQRKTNRNQILIVSDGEYAVIIGF